MARQCSLCSVLCRLPLLKQVQWLLPQLRLQLHQQLLRLDHRLLHLRLAPPCRLLVQPSPSWIQAHSSLKSTRVQISPRVRLRNIFSSPLHLSCSFRSFHCCLSIPFPPPPSLSPLPSTSIALSSFLSPYSSLHSLPTPHSTLSLPLTPLSPYPSLHSLPTPHSTLSW